MRNQESSLRAASDIRRISVAAVVSHASHHHRMKPRSVTQGTNSTPYPQPKWTDMAKAAAEKERVAQQASQKLSDMGFPSRNAQWGMPMWVARDQPLDIASVSAAAGDTSVIKEATVAVHEKAMPTAVPRIPFKGIPTVTLKSLRRATNATDEELIDALENAGLCLSGTMAAKVMQKFKRVRR